MEETQIILSGLWIAIILCHLLIDIMKIFAGDFKQGEIDKKPLKSNMFLIANLIIVIPIFMVVLNLLIANSILRIVNIVVAIIFIWFNLVEISEHKVYNKILLLISFIFKGLTIYFAWSWVI